MTIQQEIGSQQEQVERNAQNINVFYTENNLFLSPNIQDPVSYRNSEVKQFDDDMHEELFLVESEGNLDSYRYTESKGSPEKTDSFVTPEKNTPVPDKEFILEHNHENSIMVHSPENTKIIEEFKEAPKPNSVFKVKRKAKDNSAMMQMPPSIIDIPKAKPEPESDQIEQTGSVTYIESRAQKL